MSKRAALIKVPVVIILLASLSSCGFWLIPTRKEITRDFGVRGVELSKALEEAVKAAGDINFDVSVRRPDGYFYATRGLGIGEISILRFQLKRGYKQKLYFTITVKSSKGGDRVIQEFATAYYKYVDIFPDKPLVDTN